jgi:hypothetical protein
VSAVACVDVEIAYSLVSEHDGRLMNVFQLRSISTNSENSCGLVMNTSNNVGFR